MLAHKTILNIYAMKLVANFSWKIDSAWLNKFYKNTRLGSPIKVRLQSTKFASEIKKFSSSFLNISTVLDSSEVFLLLLSFLCSIFFSFLRKWTTLLLFLEFVLSSFAVLLFFADFSFWKELIDLSIKNFKQT